MSRELAKQRGDELRPEYDLSQLRGGVRGKYYKRAMAGTNLVLIEPDLAKAFPDTDAVNRHSGFCSALAAWPGPSCGDYSLPPSCDSSRSMRFNRRYRPMCNSLVPGLTRILVLH
jgi:hypothetical protein